MAEQSVTSQLNNPTFPKNFTPYSQHNKMYQPYIPSSITISSPPILSRSGG